MARSSSFRQQASLAAAPVVLAAAGLMLSTDPGAFAQESATPTPIGLVQSSAGLPRCDATRIGALPEGFDAATAYAIVPEESAARYRVEEVLAQVGRSEAVGETRAIIGLIAFDETGWPLACSRFDVDLRTLRSDDARRDNFLYENSLEAEKYPLATFVLLAVEGLEEPLVEGQEATLRLIGNLVLRDVTKLVAWEATVIVADGTLIGSAVTAFVMSDFAIEPPSVPIVLSLEEEVRLEVDITARSQA
jgi:polyisoprenoid-binding protein YceI